MANFARTSQVANTTTLDERLNDRANQRRHVDSWVSNRATGMTTNEVA